MQNIAFAHRETQNFADPQIAREDELDLYLSRRFLPWCSTESGLAIAVAEWNAVNLDFIRRHYPRAEPFAVSGQFLTDAISARFTDELVIRSTSALKIARPEFSAEKTFTSAQVIALLSLPFAIALAFLFAPRAASIAFVLLCAFGFLANGVFRAMLVWVGAGEPPKKAAVLPSTDDLPVYTILVPLYREGNVLPALVDALRALSYPREKLDIKLVLEADDIETIAAARSLHLEECFEIICVPPGLPRTKPKACNFALQFARGEFTVIFDAEDRPEPDQLLKAIAAFRASPAKIACLQAQLNFYNASENWLTRGIMAQTPQAI